MLYLCSVIITPFFDMLMKKKLKLSAPMTKATISLYLCTSNFIIMLQKGTAAPYFEGKDENGNTVKLTDFTGKKLVLYFYPKDSTPGCTAEACDLRDNYERFLSLGYNVVGVSRDSAKSHQNFIAKHQLPFHLIADTDLSILKAYEAWGEKKMYGKVTEGTLRTTYVIDENGVIIDAIGKVDTKNHTAQILE
jgi:peroxiredoxin Q/BCP